MSASKKIDMYRDFAAGVYLSDAQAHALPSPLTHCIRVPYTVYLITQGRVGEGGELNQREG